jgi:hypothetical protein
MNGLPRNTDSQRIILLPAPRLLHRQSGISSVGWALPAAPRIETTIDPQSTKPQGYRLSITPASIHIGAHDASGAFYARQTLIQLRRQFGDALPCLEIEDWPDFPVRGVMLDISRDKVPSMQTLFDLVDRLAEWKINQLQLYMEHTFAYAGHEQVWQNASPMTADEIRALDIFCKERFIELVPNQNSFGHMERWLRHPRYLPLAEAPLGSQMSSGDRWSGPFSLCPTDPASLELLHDLYSQLLPNFSSRLFNVGCDETFDIGQGRSRDVCAKLGVAQVYINFLSAVNDLVKSHDCKMMFWGDIILSHPEKIRQLPRDIIALNWGYEADHPFDAEAKLFAESGIPFYVCPGTSSWCSIAGRTQNMLANQLSAAAAGLAHGAAGFLNTDWGDFGHLQYLPISYAGLAMGAAVSWCLQANQNIPLADALDLHVFQDRAAVMGRVALELGDVYRVVGKPVKNRSALFNILVPSASRANPTMQITQENLDAAQSAIAAATARLNESDMDRADALLVCQEFQTAADMLRHACRKARRRVDPKSESGPKLTADLNRIIESHRACWLARNRPGGLEDSVSRLTDSFS